MNTYTVNGERLHATLLESYRLSLNDDDKQVRLWFIEETKRYGCKHIVDQMGNIFAIRPGRNNDIPPIGMGSHLDTQPAGGKYDGIVGVNSAIEVLKVLHENNITTYAPIAAINWTNEEGARFPPAMLSSGVWAGAFELGWAHERKDLNGVGLKEELQRIDFLGDAPCDYQKNPLSAHFEVHIEQGPILEQKDLSVGVVTGVQAINWYSIELRGREQHCGTTPMNSRADTLLCAAKMIVKVNEVAHTVPGALASVAVINSTPQAINTLAGRVQFNIDARAPSDERLAFLDEELERELRHVASQEGVKVEKWDKFWNSPRTVFDRTAVDAVRKSAKDSGFEYVEIQSGAGHDSVYTARRCPTAMIFIRCKGGISHNPAEYSTSEDIQAGAQTLLGAVLHYDQLLSAQGNEKP
ncbi:putative N-carbamoyl-L-amino acid hydrolase [Sistotremastrum suecicum HHB10207 ss-3]|uniref:Putative N-carbamoyl-L-amino acid hydrolase n=1 Tax=Sistotremastrum suecicum HHB10207 ss-3 TaxID=1314776 RepID=A0A166BFT1_9AGAM|nr:putative N-carbamoyl-L-amino acid hydrolase [Sistotremastrum suecicum HHB10207 ss-3]